MMGRRIWHAALPRPATHPRRRACQFSHRQAWQTKGCSAFPEVRHHSSLRTACKDGWMQAVGRISSGLSVFLLSLLLDAETSVQGAEKLLRWSVAGLPLLGRREGSWHLLQVACAWPLDRKQGEPKNLPGKVIFCADQSVRLSPGRENK